MSDFLQAMQGGPQGSRILVYLRGKPDPINYSRDLLPMLLGDPEVTEIIDAETGETLNWKGEFTMYYNIDENTARLAHDMMSMSTYSEGSATAEYRRMVNEAARLVENQKKRVDAIHHDELDRLLDVYARKLAKNLNDRNRIGTLCPSILIAGGSGINLRKKEKQNALMDKNMEQFRAVQKLLDKIRSVGTGGISSDDPDALEKLKQKLNKLEHDQRKMRAANAAIRLKDAAAGDAKLAALGFAPDRIKELRTPDFAGRIGYPAYMLSNNNAKIRRVRQRIQELEQRVQTLAVGWEFDGGRVEINIDLNRVQIIYDGKPDPDTRAALKGHGFRWAPSQGAWQRQYTQSAIRAAQELTR